MSWFSSLFAANAWDTGEIPIPWDTDRPSLFRFVEAHLDPDGGGLSESGRTLPDEEIRYAGKEFRWGAGVLDGAFVHHSGGGSAAAKVDAVFVALRRALNKPNFHTLQKLYALLIKDDILDYLDPLIQRLLSAGPAINIDRLGKLGLFLAVEAPDRGPVKFGIAICGAISGAADHSLFHTLGGHEEFTLYALVALTNQAALAGDDPEQEIWDLAKRVHGWGRIHAVEHLAGTQNPKIKAWLLRGGYRNRIMNEYLAQIAATTGGLVEALRDPDPDDALIEGAGGIIDALLRGGPAEDIDNYDEGPEAVSLYLQHLRCRTGTLAHLGTIGAICDFLDFDRDPKAFSRHPFTDAIAEKMLAEKERMKRLREERRGRGWSDERRQALQEIAEEVLAQTHWRDAVLSDLEAEDDSVFAIARRAAFALGFDPWEHSFRRQRTGHGEEWFNLMRTDDPDRIDRVITLAEEMIPLDKIVTETAQKLRLEPTSVRYSSLDFILQDIWRFPGRGWKLVSTALEGPVVRHRNMAIFALEHWGRENWPAEAAEVLSRAIGREPDSKIRKRMEAVLVGRPLLYPEPDQESPGAHPVDADDDRN